MAEAVAYALSGGGKLELVAVDGRMVVLLDGRQVSKPIDEQHLRVKVTVDLPDARGSVQLKRGPDGSLSIMHGGRELRRVVGKTEQAKERVRARAVAPTPGPTTPDPVAVEPSAPAERDDTVVNGAYWLAWCVLGNIIAVIGYDQVLRGAALPDDAVHFVAREMLVVAAVLGLCGLWAALSQRTAWIPLGLAVIVLVTDTLLAFAISPYIGLRVLIWRSAAMYFLVHGAARSLSLTSPASNDPVS